MTSDGAGRGMADNPKEKGGDREFVFPNKCDQRKWSVNSVYG